MSLAAHQLGGCIGTLMFLLAVPGVVVALTSHGTAAKVLSWFTLAIGIVSGLLCVLGAGLIFLSLRSSSRFKYLAWVRGRRKR